MLLVTDPDSSEDGGGGALLGWPYDCTARKCLVPFYSDYGLKIGRDQTIFQHCNILSDLNLDTKEATAPVTTPLRYVTECQSS